MGRFDCIIIYFNLIKRQRIPKNPWRYSIKRHEQDTKQNKTLHAQR